MSSFNDKAPVQKLCASTISVWLPPFNAKIHLKDFTAAFLTQELVELPEVHEIASISMGVKYGLFKACKFAQGVDAFDGPAVLTLTVKGNVLSVANHDLLPCQNLYPVKQEEMVGSVSNPAPQQAVTSNYITTGTVPGPELFAGRLRTFHTHDSRLPGHAKSRQAQVLWPIQDLLPLRLVVNVVAVNPQPAEGFRQPRRGRLFLRTWGFWYALINKEQEIVFHPFHSREHTYFPLAVFREVCI